MSHRPNPAHPWVAATLLFAWSMGLHDSAGLREMTSCDTRDKSPTELLRAPHLQEQTHGAALCLCPSPYDTASSARALRRRPAVYHALSRHDSALIHSMSHSQLNLTKSHGSAK